MGKMMFEILDELEITVAPGDIKDLHTGTLMNFMKEARKSPDKYYKFYRNMRIYVTNHAGLKALLDTREHVLSKTERKALRQEKAKYGN